MIFYMLDFILKATLVSFFPKVLIIAIVFIFLTGYIYGYSISFLFGIKRTFTIGFFVIMLTSILILISSTGFLFTAPCSFLMNSNVCPEDLPILTRLAFSLFLLLSHFFINFSLGHLGVLLGVISYFPSELFLNRYIKIKTMKKSVSEIENLEVLSTQITMGTRKLE